MRNIQKIIEIVLTELIETLIIKTIFLDNDVSRRVGVFFIVAGDIAETILTGIKHLFVSSAIRISSLLHEIFIERKKVAEMKKKGSYLLVFIMTVFFALALSACGSGSDNSSDQSGDSSKKVLRVGMECAYAPFNWTQPDDSNGAVPIAGTKDYAYGYDIMVAKKVAEAMDAELEIYKIKWDGLIPAVQSNKIDAVIAGMCITDERSTSIDFSDVYYRADIVAITTKENKYENAKSLADLTGAKMTSQLNSVWYGMIDQIPGVEKTTAIDTVPGVIVSLTSGKSDAVVVDMPTAIAAQASNPDIVILSLPNGGFRVEPGDVNMGIGVKKGNKELLEKINDVVSTITDNDRKIMMEEAVEKQPLAE